MTVPFWQRMRFHRVILAASVLPRDYEWRTLFENTQVQEVSNHRASRDVPVGIVCNLLRSLGTSDVGTAGFHGFLGGREEIKEVYYYDGGHSAPVERLARLLLPTQRGRFIRGDSHDPVIRTAAVAALDAPIDVLMIDGDHTYAGVRKDFEEYAPLVRAGGLIVFHDILPHPGVPACQVDRLWREIRDGYQHHEYCEPDHDAGWGQWGGIGVLRWIP